jgi:hypothetical protein
VYRIIIVISEKRDKSVSHLLPYGLLLLSLLYFPKLSELNKYANQNYPQALQNYISLAIDVKKSGSDNLVVACRKPAMFYFFSDAFVTNYKYSLDDKEVIKQFINKDVKYVVLDQLASSSTRYLYPAITKNQELFQVINHKKNPDTYLLSFNIEKAKEIFNQ